MSEANLWQNMRVAMGKPKHWLEATRHEDKLQSGICDVSFITKLRNHGWMELKQIKKYPARATSIVRVEHYTTEQKQFIRRKGKRGGMTFLFIQVERDYYLFDWIGAQNLGHLTRKGMEETAVDWWAGKMNWEELGVDLDIYGGRRKIW